MVTKVDMMSFESPDVEKEFPGLYASQGLGDEGEFSEEEERHRKKDSGKKKESKKERKDKGYMMFEEEDSEEELVIDDTRSPSKMKKHSKPSFKFPKKEKAFKAKEKEKEKEKDREEKKDKETKKEDKKIKLKKKKLGAGSKTDVRGSDVKPIFGAPLAQAVARSKCHDGIQLPAIFRECIDYIEEFGLSCEGIYRISGVKSKVTALKDAYNTGEPVYLHEHEPNIVASLLKQYLRELPEPVLTIELMPRFEQSSTIKNVKEIIEQFQHLIEELPTPNRLLLSWMISHMTHVIAKESQNKMSLQNVSIVLSPTMQISHRVLNVFFTYSKILFRDVVIKRYVPPLRPVSSRWSLELPDSPSALEEELHKQESLLSQLHEDLKKIRDTEKEEQVWEVQRVVTQLKRKLKHAKKAQENILEADKREKALAFEKTERLNLALAKPKEETEPKKTTPTKKVNAPKPPHLQKHVPKEEPAGKEPVKEEEVTKKLEVVKKEEPDAEKPVEESQVSAQLQTSQEPQVSAEEIGQPAPDVKEVKPQVEASEEEKKIPTQTVPDVVQNVPEVREEDSQELIEEKSDETDKSPESSPEEERLKTDEDVKEDVERIAKQVESVQLEDVDIKPVNDGVSQQVAPVDVVNDEPTPSAPEEEVVSSSICSSSSPELTSSDDDGSAEEVPVLPLMDEEYEELLQEHQALLLEEEELQAIGDELRQKIDTEKSEIDRLHQEIGELRAIHDALYEDDSSAASDSSEESEDEEELQEILQQLVHDNQQLQKENADLCEKIHQERQICLDVKVKIRMIQHR